MAVTISDVEKLDAKGWEHLPDAKKTALLEDAETLSETVYGDDVATLPTIESNVDTFKKYLAAHLWELAEGGEAGSESNTGGNVSYSLGNPTETYQSLSQTRYGRTCTAMLGGRDGIGIVRTY
jgi:hypothetical protein